MLVELVNEQDSSVVKHEIELGEDGLAFIDKIPLGRYQVSVYAYDEGKNELYRTATPENVEIRAGKLATLHVTLIPSNTGSLLIVVKIDEPKPPEGVIATTIKGKVTGDGEKSVAGARIWLDWPGGGLIYLAEADASGHFEARNVELIAAEGYEYFLRVSPPLYHPNYYATMHKPLSVSMGDVPELNMWEIGLPSDYFCVHVTVTKNGDPAAGIPVHVKLTGKNIGSTTGADTDQNGVLYITCPPVEDARLEVIVDGEVEVSVEGNFASRNTYDYTISL